MKSYWKLPSLYPVTKFLCFTQRTKGRGRINDPNKFLSGHFKILIIFFLKKVNTFAIIYNFFSFSIIYFLINDIFVNDNSIKNNCRKISYLCGSMTKYNLYIARNIRIDEAALSPLFIGAFLFNAVKKKNQITKQ